MPVSTSSNPLGTMLRQRLEVSLPRQEHALAFSALHLSLTRMHNIEPATHHPPPTDSAACGVMGGIYLRLTTPVPGELARPYTAEEARTLRMVHYLHEVETAPAVNAGTATTAGLIPQSQLHAHMQGELRREFGLLPCIGPQWRETAVDSATALLLTASLQCELQPTEIRAFDVRALRPQPGRHAGGVELRLAAWHPSAPPPTVPKPSSAAIAWDPSDPLSSGEGELDLLHAPLVRRWTGMAP